MSRKTNGSYFYISLLNLYDLIHRKSWGKCFKILYNLGCKNRLKYKMVSKSHKIER